jgi:hypothetical protein
MLLYRQSILLFGLILPLAIAVTLVLACYLLKSNLEDSYRNNIAGYKSSDEVRRTSLTIEGKVIRQRPDMERWNALLSQETGNNVRSQLDAIISQLPPKEIQVTSFLPSSVKAGIGGVSAQKSSQLQFTLRGTFHTIQRAFLELETRLPQLQLGEQKFDLTSNSSSLLTVTATYTVWEN